MVGVGGKALRFNRIGRRQDGDNQSGPSLMVASVLPGPAVVKWKNIKYDIFYLINPLYIVFCSLPCKPNEDAHGGDGVDRFMVSR